MSQLLAVVTNWNLLTARWRRHFPLFFLYRGSDTEKRFRQVQFVVDFIERDFDADAVQLQHVVALGVGAMGPIGAVFSEVVDVDAVLLNENVFFKCLDGFVEVKFAGAVVFFGCLGENLENNFGGEER